MFPNEIFSGAFTFSFDDDDTRRQGVIDVILTNDEFTAVFSVDGEVVVTISSEE